MVSVIRPLHRYVNSEHATQCDLSETLCRALQRPRGSEERKRDGGWKEERREHNHRGCLLSAGAALDELHALATEKQLRGEWLRVIAFDPL